MKIFTVILLFTIPVTLNAEECSPERTVILKRMIESNALGGKDVENGKLEKFTHHDYPISCNIKLESGVYHWFTDEAQSRFIIEEKTEGLSKYYGLFK